MIQPHPLIRSNPVVKTFHRVIVLIPASRTDGPLPNVVKTKSLFSLFFIFFFFKCMSKIHKNTVRLFSQMSSFVLRKHSKPRVGWSCGLFLLCACFLSLSSFFVSFSRFSCLLPGSGFDIGRTALCTSSHWISRFLFPTYIAVCLFVCVHIASSCYHE